MIRLSFPQQTIIAIRVNYRFVRTCSQSSLREFDAELNDTLRKIIGYCVKTTNSAILVHSSWQYLPRDFYKRDDSTRLYLTIYVISLCVLKTKIVDRISLKIIYRTIKLGIVRATSINIYRSE